MNRTIKSSTAFLLLLFFACWNYQAAAVWSVTPSSAPDDDTVLARQSHAEESSDPAPDPEGDRESVDLQKDAEEENGPGDQSQKQPGGLADETPEDAGLENEPQPGSQSESAEEPVQPAVTQPAVTGPPISAPEATGPAATAPAVTAPAVTQPGLEMEEDLSDAAITPPFILRIPSRITIEDLLIAETPDRANPGIKGRIGYGTIALEPTEFWPISLQAIAITVDTLEGAFVLQDKTKAEEELNYTISANNSTVEYNGLLATLDPDNPSVDFTVRIHQLPPWPGLYRGNLKFSVTLKQ